MSNRKTLPTPSPRRSVYNTPVLVGKEGKAPSQPPAHPAGTKTWAACSREHSNQQSPHDLQPEQHLSRFHKVSPPLHPTIRPLTGNHLGSQPSAGAASGAPEGEAQSIPNKLAKFSGAGRGQISRANANALAAEGNAGKDYGAGGVIGIGGNPHPGTAGRGLVAQPAGEGGDLGGGVEALEQFGGGMEQRRTCGAADE
jgi:hypothetical protein